MLRSAIRLSQVVLGDTREIGEPDGIKLNTANKLCQSVPNPADEAVEGFFDVVPGMLEAFGSDAKRSCQLTSTIKEGV